MNFFRKFKFEIIICLIFILLTLVFTFPLVFNLRSQIYDYKGDLLETLWYVWWAKYAWQYDLSSQFVPIIAVPFGIDLSQDIAKNISLSFANYPLLMLTVLTDEIFAYNFIMLLTFPLAGMAMYLLTYYFTKSRWGSFFAGLAFSFCPYHFAHASHITLANIQWMPLFVLFLFKMHNERTYLSATLCGLFFALTLLSDTYYGFFMLVLAGTFVIFKLFRRLIHKRANFVPHTGFFKNLSLIVIAVFVAVLIWFPYIFPILRSYLFENGAGLSLQKYIRDISQLYIYSTKMFDYILPATNQPVFGSITQKFVGSIFYGESVQEHSLYLGLVTIFLAFFGYRFWQDRKKMQVQDVAERRRLDFSIKFFASLAIVAFLFSLSPTFMILGRHIKMPSYYVFQVLPFFRAIARFGIIVILALCVLAGFGFKFLIERLNNPLKKTTVKYSLIFLLVFEFMNIPPFRTTDIGNVPEVYLWLKDQNEKSIVIEYPLGNDVEYIFYQRVHKKRLVNGALPKTEAYSIAEKIKDITKPGTTDILRKLDVEFVILHLDSDDYQQSEQLVIMKELDNFDKKYGLVLIKEFNGTKVFKLRKD